MIFLMKVHEKKEVLWRIKCFINKNNTHNNQQPTYKPIWGEKDEKNGALHNG